MKSAFNIPGLIIIGLLISISAFSQNATEVKISGDIPSDVAGIFSNSCLQCHSDEGSGIAKAKLNFTDWDSYNDKKQANKAEDICKEVTKDAMPPKRFLSSNPAAALTDEQKEMICNWSETVSTEE